MKYPVSLLPLLFALVMPVSRADAQAYQPFPTSDASWDIVRCWYFYEPGWYDRYTVTMDGSDTLYEGQTFKNLYITNHHLPGTVHDTIYPRQYFGGIREADRRIYMFQKWASTDTTVQLVYDFSNTNVGDTIFTNVLSGNPDLFGHLVTATDSILIGTEYHKRLHLQDPGNAANSESWIEGVGSSWGLPFATFWSATDNSYDLTCFYRNRELVYGNPSPVYGYCQVPHPNVTCDPVLSVTSPRVPQTEAFFMYPNPSSDIVTIFFTTPVNGELMLDVYDVAGVLHRSVRLTPHESGIYVGDLRSGMYVLTLRSGNAVQGSRLLIIRR